MMPGGARLRSRRETRALQAIGERSYGAEVRAAWLAHFPGIVLLGLIGLVAARVLVRIALS